MTVPITLSDVANLANFNTAGATIDANSAAIETGFASALDTSGDAMHGPLDMNSFQVINLPAPATAESPLRLQDLVIFNGGGSISTLPDGGLLNQALLKNSSVDADFSWQYPVITGDATNTGTALTVSPNAIGNTKLAQAPANTIKGNPTTSTANDQDFTISGLTTKGTPTSNDLVIIADVANGGALKSATVGTIGTASGVASINATTGAFTTGTGLTTSSNVLSLTPARQTLPTRQVFNSGSGTYTTPANCLYLHIRMVGGGGGGSGAGTTGPGSGGNGGVTTFNSVSANGGLGSTATGGNGGQGSGGSGGSGGTGTANLRISGGTGHLGFGNGIATGNVNFPGHGGDTSISGGTIGVGVNGSGGSGGGSSSVASGNGGGGGGGEYVEFFINSPTSTYSWTTGAGGSGGAGGTGGNGGNSGGNGLIIVDEYYGS